VREGGDVQPHVLRSGMHFSFCMMFWETVLEAANSGSHSCGGCDVSNARSIGRISALETKEDLPSSPRRHLGERRIFWDWRFVPRVSAEARATPGEDALVREHAPRPARKCRTLRARALQCGTDRSSRGGGLVRWHFLLRRISGTGASHNRCEGVLWGGKQAER
jgi:hypothetical protein